MPTEVATVVVETTRTVQIEVPGPAYSNVRVAAYLQGILTANGDLLVVAGGVLARVGVGSSGQVLTVSGGAPVWAAPTGMANPMSAQGDLIIGGASGTPTRLPIGTNGQILSVSGSTLAWIDAPTTYTDADAIAAIAGELTDSQLVQRVNANSIQGISLATIYAGAIDAIEALGNGVAVTTAGTLANVTGTNGQVLTHNGTTWVAATPSSGFSNPMTTLGDIITGGVSGAAQRLGVGSESQVLKVVSGVPAWAAESGMANPMTTAWDLIRGGSSGAPTRFAVGSLRSRLGVLGDGTLGYAPVPGVNASPRGVSGFSWATSTGSPATVGEITIARTATTVTNPGNRCYPVGTNFQRHQAATGSAPNRTTWIGQIGSLSSQWGRASASAFIYTRSMTSDQVIGVGIFTSGSAYSGLTIPVATNSAVGADQQIWLRHRGGQTNYEFVTVAASGSVLVDTGVAYVVGVQTCLRVWQDVDGCCWQIWSATTNGAWTLLGEGYAATNPTNNTLSGYAQFAGSVGQSNVSGTAGDIEVNGVHVALLAMGSA